METQVSGEPDLDGADDSLEGENSQSSLREESFGNADDGTWDFSLLPDPIWVKVMEFLPLADQYHVSVTCRALHAAFLHPSNWKTADLRIMGGAHNFSKQHTSIPEPLKQLVLSFGRYFQRLSVSLHGHLLLMREDVREVLSHMARVCRLTHLMLEVGQLTSRFHLSGLAPLKNDLRLILTLVDSAFRLKTLEVLSWPMFPRIFDDPTTNVFEAMKRNSRLRSLESLSLFGMKNKHWSERLPLLPSAQYTAALVAHFPALKRLALRSPMLSKQLVQDLAHPSREKLLSLQVLLCHSGHDQQYRFPEIEASAWANLRQRSPELQVELIMMSLIPDYDLSFILQSELPLGSVSILKYARCSADLLSSLAAHYKLSLRTLACYNDPRDCGEALVALVDACPHLDSLLFHGQIHVNQLLSLARRRSHWRLFDFLEKQIISEEEEHFEDDVVIGRRPGGELVQLGLVHFHGEQSAEERQERLEALSAEVSPRVGYLWQPG